MIDIGDLVSVPKATLLSNVPNIKGQGPFRVLTPDQISLVIYVKKYYMDRVAFLLTPMGCFWLNCVELEKEN